MRFNPLFSTHSVVFSAYLMRAGGNEDAGFGHPAHTVAVHAHISMHNHPGPPHHLCHVRRPPPVQLYSMYHMVNVCYAGGTRITGDVD